MSRLAFRSAVTAAVAEARDRPLASAEVRTLSARVEALETDLEALPTPAARLEHAAALYRAVLAAGASSSAASASVGEGGGGLSDAQQRRLALVHATLALPHAIVCNEHDLVALGLATGPKNDKADGKAESKVDAKEGARMQRGRVHLFFDMSASMKVAARHELLAAVLSLLGERERTRGLAVDVFTFGDDKHHLRAPLTLAEFAARLADNRLQFNGGTTQLHEAWELSSRQASGDAVGLIVSDGDFNGRPLSELVVNRNLRAICFFAPIWSPPDVTQRHAGVLSSKVAEGTSYSGEVPPGRVSDLGDALDRYVGAGIVPELPGRTRLGTTSIPTLLLLPLHMQTALSLCLPSSALGLDDSRPDGKANDKANGKADSKADSKANSKADSEEGLVQADRNGVFLLRLATLFEQLLLSAKQDSEHCLLGPSFRELMSLCPCLIKRSEAAVVSLVVGGVHDGLRRQWANLLARVTAVREFVAAEMPRLRAKHAKDPARLAELEMALQRATTVSERDDILERNGAPVGYLEFPTCVDLAALAALFHRLRTVFAAPETPDVDHLLVALFRSMAIVPRPPCSPEFAVPVWRRARKVSSALTPTQAASAASSSSSESRAESKERKEVKADGPVEEGGIDVLAVLRLLPGYLRQQQTAQGAPVTPDFTFQPRTAQRIACLLHVAELQGARFPRWLSAGLSSIVRGIFASALRASSSAASAGSAVPEGGSGLLTSPLDDDNVTVFWMHLLRQLRDSPAVTSLQLATPPAHPPPALFVLRPAVLASADGRSDGKSNVDGAERETKHEAKRESVVLSPKDEAKSEAKGKSGDKSGETDKEGQAQIDWEVEDKAVVADDNGLVETTRLGDWVLGLCRPRDVDAVLGWVQWRQVALALHWFLQRQLPFDGEPIEHQVPLYPNTVPFVAKDLPVPAYIVRCSAPPSSGSLAEAGSSERKASADDGLVELVDAETGEPYRCETLTDSRAIAKAYEINYRLNGAHVRPTYLTGGRVTLWRSAGPTREQLLEEQLERLGVPEMQRRAHLHTMRNANAVLAVPWRADSREVDAAVARVKAACAGAPMLTERAVWRLPRAEIVRALVADALSVPHSAHVPGWLHDAARRLALGLHGAATFGAEHKASCVNVVEYVLACAEGTVALDAKALASPSTLTPPAGAVDGARAALVRYGRELVAHLARQLTAPRLFAESSAYLRQPLPVATAPLPANDHKGSASVASVAGAAPAPAASLRAGPGPVAGAGLNVKELEERLQCPVLLTRMVRPHVVSPCGHTFDLAAIEPIFKARRPCPVCQGAMTLLSPNYSLMAIAELVPDSDA